MRVAIFHSARDSPKAPQRHKANPTAELVTDCDQLAGPEPQSAVWLRYSASGRVPRKMGVT